MYTFLLRFRCLTLKLCSLQWFDADGWVTGRASGLKVELGVGFWW